MWELDYKESWTLKNWCFWTVVLEKTLESPLDCKEIQPVSPKGNQSWIFIVRTEVEAETPIVWPPDAKNWLIWKDPDAENDRRWEEKGTTENEMVGWHHWLNGHEFEQAAGVGGGQGGLACCSPLGLKESDMTEWLNWTEHHMGSTSGSESHPVALFSTMDYAYSPWDSPARILDWVAFPFSRESSQPRDWTHISHIAGGFFISWATTEAQEAQGYHWSG